MAELLELLSHAPTRMKLSCYAPPQALTMWNPAADVRAEDKSDNTISILDVIGIDFWTGEGVTAKRISAALRSIGDQDVIVNVNSPGGSFFEGLAIYNALRQHPRNVTVNILGVAASAASVIAMAGDTINIAKAGFMMNHNTMIGLYGNKETFRREADWLEQFDDVAAQLFSDRSGEDLSSIQAELAAAGEDGVWMSGVKAVERGYADALLEADVENKTKSPEQAALTDKKIIDQLMALHEFTRSERKRIQQSLKGGTPRAASTDTPRAVDETGVNDLLQTIRQHKEKTNV